MPDLTSIERILQTLFTSEAELLARQTGLVRRHTKLTGPLLPLVSVAEFIQHPTASYNILAQVAADHGVQLTRQSIHPSGYCPASHNTGSGLFSDAVPT